MTPTPESQQAALPEELQRVAETVKESGGWWHHCSGCTNSTEGHFDGPYPFSNVFQCHMGSGCHECGGLGVVWNYYDEATLREMAQEPDAPAPVDVSHAVREALIKEMRDTASAGPNMSAVHNMLHRAADMLEALSAPVDARETSADPIKVMDVFDRKYEAAIKSGLLHKEARGLALAEVDALYAQILRQRASKPSDSDTLETLLRKFLFKDKAKGIMWSLREVADNVLSNWAPPSKPQPVVTEWQLLGDYCFPAYGRDHAFWRKGWSKPIIMIFTEEGDEMHDFEEGEDPTHFCELPELPDDEAALSAHPQKEGA